MRASERFGGSRAWFVLILLGIVAPTGGSWAQEQSDSAEFETWTDIATIYKFNERLRYDGDYGIRFLFTTRGFWQLYLRPSVRYDAKPWLRLHGGAAWFHTSIDDAGNINELRPWIGLRFVGPKPGGFVFSNYFRFEMRSFKGGSIRDWRTVGRARYQLQVTSPRFKIAGSEGFYALSFFETFKDFGQSIDGLFLSQFRFDVGMGKQITPALRLELNYLYQKVGIEGTGLEPSDHILRFRMFYGFN